MLGRGKEGTKKVRHESPDVFSVIFSITLFSFLILTNFWSCKFSGCVSDQNDIFIQANKNYDFMIL